MPTVNKTTAQIIFGTWTTIQHRGTGQLSDAPPLDDLTVTASTAAVLTATTAAVLTATTAAALTPNGFEFVDGGGGNDQINRNDAGDWLAEGYFVGGSIVVANSETPANDGTYVILAITATDIDVATGSLTAGVDDNTATFTGPNGFDFVDGGGGNDQINRNDGGSWLTEGYFLGGSIVVANSETPANDGTYVILAITATDIDVATASFTAGVDDNTVTFTGPNGFDFVDGGGGNDQITRNDGGDWLAEGYFVSGSIVVANSETPANDGTYIILAVTATDIDVATASFTAGVDDNTVTFSGGGPGPFLVFEKSIWKYPEQVVCGRVQLPANAGRPIRLMHIMADLGASTAWTLHVTNDNNTTDTPYPSADAAKYNEGDITIAGATSQFISSSFAGDVEPSAILFPGQRIFMTTAAAVNPVVRFTFSLAYDTKGG